MRTVNIGSIANDGTGDDIRIAFDKINQNFNEVYSSSGVLSSVTASPGNNVTRDSNASIFVNQIFFKNSFPDLPSLPSPVTYPGMFVTVVGLGAYYSNGTTWVSLPAYNATGVVNRGVMRWSSSTAMFSASDPGVITLNGKSGYVDLTASDIVNILGFLPMSSGGGSIGPGDMILAGTGALKIPSGLTIQRPIVPIPGMIRYNNQTSSIEGFIGPEGSASWQTIGPLGSAPATFTSATINDLTSATITATTITATSGFNGALGTITPAPASVTSLTAARNVTITQATPTVGPGTGALVVTGGTSIGNNLYVGGTATINDTSNASSTTSAAVVMAGGLGVAKNVYVGGELHVSSATQSFNATNGALVLTGGIGVAKNVNIGGTLAVTGDLGVTGNTSLTALGVSAATTLLGILTVSGAASVNNSLSVTGYIQPSAGNSATNGIIFPTNPGGGGGDGAVIQYYATAGEQTELLISVANDPTDNIRLTASGQVIVSNTLTVNSVLSLTQFQERLSSYSDSIGSGSTVIVDCSTGNIQYITSTVSGPWTANLTNLNLDAGNATTIVLFINQGGSAYVPDLKIAGSAQTINWTNGVTPLGNSGKKDIVSFSILRTIGTTYVVLGQLVTFG